MIRHSTRAAITALLAGAGLMALPAPGMAQAAKAAAAVPPAAPDPLANISPEVRAKALELADLLNGEKVTRVQLDKVVGQTLPQQMRADANMQALEAKYPGVINHVVKTVGDIVVPLALARLPKLIEMIAGIYARRMSAGEIGETLDFYRSPTGAWVLDTVAKGADFSQLLKSAAADPAHQVNAADVGQVTGGARGALNAGLTPERRIALIKFSLSSAGMKLTAVNQEIAQLAADQANATRAEDGSRVGNAVREAVQQYIKDADARAAKGAAPAGKTPSP